MRVRWTSWAARPNEPSGFRGHKELLNCASALVTTCPWYVIWHLRTLSITSSSSSHYSLSLICQPDIRGHEAPHHHHQCSTLIVQELCESRGGCPGLSVLTSLLVSVDIKNYWTMLWHCIGHNLSLICQLTTEDIKHHFIIINAQHHKAVCNRYYICYNTDMFSQSLESQTNFIMFRHGNHWKWSATYTHTLQWITLTLMKIVQTLSIILETQVSLTTHTFDICFLLFLFLFVT